jgi:hypothetical protein
VAAHVHEGSSLAKHLLQLLVKPENHFFSNPYCHHRLDQLSFQLAVLEAAHDETDFFFTEVDDSHILVFPCVAVTESDHFVESPFQHHLQGVGHKLPLPLYSGMSSLHSRQNDLCPSAFDIKFDELVHVPPALGSIPRRHLQIFLLHVSSFESIQQPPIVLHLTLCLAFDLRLSLDVIDVVFVFLLFLTFEF